MRSSKPFFGVIFLIILTFISCQNSEKPPIPPDQMKTILFDLQTAEAYSTLVPEDGVKNVSKKNQDSLAYYIALVFKKHNLDQQTFTAALDWYLQRHDYSDKLYTDIIDTANFFKEKFAIPKNKEIEDANSTAIEANDEETEVEEKSSPFSRPRDRMEQVDGVSSPVEKEEMEAIKQKSKEQKAALEKVRKEN